MQSLSKPAAQSASNKLQQYSHALHSQSFVLAHEWRQRWPINRRLFLSQQTLAENGFVLCAVTVQVWAVPLHLRSLSSGLAQVASHALGDVPAPPLVGLIQGQFLWHQLANRDASVDELTMHKTSCHLYWSFPTHAVLAHAETPRSPLNMLTLIQSTFAVMVCCDVAPFIAAGALQQRPSHAHDVFVLHEALQPLVI